VTTSPLVEATLTQEFVKLDKIEFSTSPDNSNLKALAATGIDDVEYTIYKR
jgi:hypothetical protein